MSDEPTDTQDGFEEEEEEEYVFEYDSDEPDSVDSAGGSDDAEKQDSPMKDIEGKDSSISSSGLSNGSSSGTRRSRVGSDPSPRKHAKVVEGTSPGSSSSEPFAVFAPEDILKFQMVEVKKVQAIIQMPSTSARQLLQHFKWDAAKFLERYYDCGDQDALLKGAGVVLEDIPDLSGAAAPSPGAPAGSADTLTTCNVCFDELPRDKCASLKCKHTYCQECWTHYLKGKIVDEGESVLIKCIEPKCSALADEGFVQDIISDAHAKQLYIKLLVKEYVQSHRCLTFCVGHDCTNALYLRNPTERSTVTCTCGETFCFSCGADAHAPATCTMVRKWTTSLESTGENANYMAKNTRECPKCNTTIDKDGGCQYVRCTQCRHGFCWVCMGAFDHVSHNCNCYKDSGKGRRHELNKLAHFSSRYRIHKQARKQEEPLATRASKVSDELCKVHSWSSIEASFLSYAVATLLNARNTLQSTYIYGYYLPDGTNRELFEHLQAGLEKATERLSLTLGTILDPEDVSWREWKADVVNKASNVKQRLSNLLEGCQDGDIVGGKGNADGNYAVKLNYKGFKVK